MPSLLASIIIMIARIYPVRAIAKHYILSNLHDLSSQPHHALGTTIISFLWMGNSGRDVSHLPKVTELVSDSVKTGTLQAALSLTGERLAGLRWKVSPPNFLARALFARLRGLS